MIVVYHGCLPYERSREHGLMEAYTRRTRLIYVDPDTVRTNAASQVYQRMRTALSNEGHSTGVVSVSLPSRLPAGRFCPVARLNRWLALRRLLSAVKALSRDPVVLVSQRPDLLPTVRGLPADLRVYEVFDDYVGLALNTGAARQTRRGHLRMVRESDLVWATSKTLVEDLRAVRPDVFETRNGVEFDLFAAARPDEAPLALKEVPHPRIGLIGNLNGRVDWDLLARLCRERPDWNVTLIGPLYSATREDAERLAALVAYANGYYVPAVPQEQVPACVASFDVCLLPYRLTRTTLRMNPLKVYQYLARGKPVVATALPAVVELEDVVTCCDNAEGFVAAIEAALKGCGGEAARNARQDRARAFDWQVIADQRLDMLSERLSEPFR